jgi:hypothetical protein
MRNFYAAACALLIVAGLVHFVLLTFATVAVGWFCVVAVVLAQGLRRSARTASLRGLSVETLDTTWKDLHLGRTKDGLTEA